MELFVTTEFRRRLQIDEDIAVSISLTFGLLHRLCPNSLTARKVRVLPKLKHVIAGGSKDTRGMPEEETKTLLKIGLFMIV